MNLPSQSKQAKKFAQALKSAPARVSSIASKVTCVLIWLVISLANFGPANAIPAITAHEFPDGYVDRSVAVTFEDSVARIEYSVGCSPNTMKELMIRWVRENENEGKPKGASELKNDSDKLKGPIEAIKALSDPTKIESLFRERLLPRVVDKVDIVVNQLTIQAEPISVEISPRHHIKATAVMEFEFEGEGSHDFQITDRMFSEIEGAIRYAAKAKGDAMLVRSNVASILIRAERNELADLSKAQVAEKTVIKGAVAFVEIDEP